MTPEQRDALATFACREMADPANKLALGTDNALAAEYVYYAAMREGTIRDAGQDHAAEIRSIVQVMENAGAHRAALSDTVTPLVGNPNGGRT